MIRAANLRREPYPTFLADYLASGQWPDLAEAHAVQYFKPRDYVERAWHELRVSILDSFIAEYPGCRPWAWWEYDAPRAPLGVFPGCWFDGTLSEPRLRLGGTGTPANDALNYVPAFAFGIPIDWVREWAVSYYNGRALDVHGQRIGAEYSEGHFPYFAIDTDDPPIFESQAAYLERHGLLSTAEARHASFEPEIVRFRDEETIGEFSD